MFSMTYTCTKCNEQKLENDFYKDKSKSLGTYPCKLCIKSTRKQYYQSNKDKIKSTVAEYRKSNPEKVKAVNKTWRKKNLENVKNRDRQKYLSRRKQVLARAKEYAQENKEQIKLRRSRYYEQNKESIIAKIRKYEQENKDKICAWKRLARAKRRCAEKNATPKWAKLDLIKEFYLNCPKGYEVDHILPIQSEFVCGLHVHYNLQYLTKLENASKGNRLKGIDNYTK